MDIEFLCSDRNVLKHFPIVPAKDCLPQWYKELHAQDNNGVPTVAGCMPVRDMVTSGYIVPNAFEQASLAAQRFAKVPASSLRECAFFCSLSEKTLFLNRVPCRSSTFCILLMFVKSVPIPSIKFST